MPISPQHTVTHTYTCAQTHSLHFQFHSISLNTSHTFLFSFSTFNHTFISNFIFIFKDKYGWTPLHCAAYHGSLECAEKLIKLGASVEHKNKVGKTALHLSGSMGWKSMCDLLLEYGGNLNTQVTYNFLLKPV